ncbi:MAG: citrate synthase [Planctomycetes bacterium]|nr:citrate synthase [Planctomycetota bacterium]
MAGDGEVHSGLAGVISHRSSISSIIGATLTYRGIDIDELAENGTFEEIVCLLWNGSLPRRDALEDLRSGLLREFELPAGVLRILREVPRDADPMRVLQLAVGALGAFDPDRDSNAPEANRRKALRLTAKLSAVTCAFHRIRSGKDPVEAPSEPGFAATFFHILNGRKPDHVEAEAIDKALILHADHELNASTFAARVTASTLSDMHSAIASAIGTLKGPLHGGANRAVMETIQAIGSVERVEPWLDDALARKEKVMGFGHRVYKQGDPRAKHLKLLSRQLGDLTGQRRWYEISERLEALVRERKGLLPNVDFYSASTYYCLGIPPDLYTPIFACSRVVGWIAHLFEQYADNDLIRPRALYTGPKEAHWVKIGDR